MARKRKNRRMFTREQRQQDRQARERAQAALPQWRRDEALIHQYLDTCAGRTSDIAEAWLALCDEPDPVEYEVKLKAAMARELRRRTRQHATREVAEDLVERAREEEAL